YEPEKWVEDCLGSSDSGRRILMAGRAGTLGARQLTIPRLCFSGDARLAPYNRTWRSCMQHRVSVSINGKTHEAEVEPRLLLVHYLRDVAGLTGTHVGCDTSQCGACTVLIGGKAVKSCTMFAVQAQDADVQTIEGLATGGQPHPRPQACWDEHALPWGSCTPGFI